MKPVKFRFAGVFCVLAVLAFTLYAAKAQSLNVIKRLSPSNTNATTETMEVRNFDVETFSFKVSEEFKSLRLFYEIYQNGRLLEVKPDEDNGFAFDLRGGQGRIQIQYAGDTGDSQIDLKIFHLRKEGVSSGLSTYFLAPFEPSTIVSSALEREDIEEGRELLLFYSALSEGNPAHGYNNDYLMENPEYLANYEYVYLVKAVFSTQAAGATAIAKD